MLFEGIFHGFWINVSGTDAPTLDRRSAVATTILVLFQDKFPPVAIVEIAHRGVTLLNLLEEMQYRLAALGEVHFSVEVDVQVIIIAQ